MAKKARRAEALVIHLQWLRAQRRRVCATACGLTGDTGARGWRTRRHPHTLSLDLPATLGLRAIAHLNARSC